MPDISTINTVAVADINKFQSITFAHGQKVNNQDVSLVTDAHTWIADNSSDITNLSDITFNSGINSTYDVYEFIFTNVHALTNNVYFQFQVNSTNGSHTTYDDSYISSMFHSAYHDEPSGTFASGPNYETGDDNGSSNSFIRLAKWVASGADESLSGKFTLYAPSSPTYVKNFASRIANLKIEQAIADIWVAGYVNTITPIDDIRFKMSSGNLDGLIEMYGLAKS